MNFEKPVIAGESNKHENIKRMIAGAVLSASALAGQSAEAQTTERVEQREQMEMLASGILSQSNEVFTVEVKPGSVKPRADGKSSTFRDYNCEDITVKIANEVFKCDDKMVVVPRGPQLPKAIITVTNDQGREITFSFLKPANIKNVEDLRTYEVPSDQQGNPVFYSYGDTKFAKTDVGIKYNTAGMSSGQTTPGVFKLEGVQLQGVLAQYGLIQKK